jgi:hypothetical protein
MDFTPEDMEAVQACLDGIDRNVPVCVEPTAAALLLPHTVYSVAEPAGAPRVASRANFDSSWNAGSPTSKLG